MTLLSNEIFMYAMVFVVTLLTYAVSIIILTSLIKYSRPIYLYSIVYSAVVWILIINFWISYGVSVEPSKWDLTLMISISVVTMLFMMLVYIASLLCSQAIESRKPPPYFPPHEEESKWVLPSYNSPNLLSLSEATAPLLPHSLLSK
jgi:hypothetical protein